MRVAMVCLGNICRSPIAEHVLRAKAEDAGLGIEVVSAGTGSWHIGEPADHRAAAVLAKFGYTNQHRAQQFDAGWFVHRIESSGRLSRSVRPVATRAPHASEKVRASAGTRLGYIPYAIEF